MTQLQDTAKTWINPANVVTLSTSTCNIAFSEGGHAADIIINGTMRLTYHDMDAEELERKLAYDMEILKGNAPNKVSQGEDWRKSYIHHKERPKTEPPEKR